MTAHANTQLTVCAHDDGVYYELLASGFILLRSPTDSTNRAVGRCNTVLPSGSDSFTVTGRLNFTEQPVDTGGCQHTGQQNPLIRSFPLGSVSFTVTGRQTQLYRAVGRFIHGPSFLK